MARDSRGYRRSAREYPFSLPSERSADDGGMLSEDDLPVGDADEIRALLQRHVLAPARRLASLPPLGVGPIECQVQKGKVYLDPNSGDTVSRHPKPAWGPASRPLLWQTGSCGGDLYVYEPGDRSAIVPHELGALRDLDVSQDGRLLLAACVTKDGARSPDRPDEPYGGVALWDRETHRGWWLVHPTRSTGHLMGRITGVRFCDDTYILVDTPNGATNGAVILWDVTKLPADPKAPDEGWGT